MQLCSLTWGLWALPPEDLWLLLLGTYMGQTPEEASWNVQNITLLARWSQEVLLNHCIPVSGRSFHWVVPKEQQGSAHGGFFFQRLY